jgi:integrase
MALGNSCHAVVGKLGVDEIDTAAVLGVLKPIWNRIPETASRVRSRIEAVIDFAKAHKWRSGPGGASLENPAVWRGTLAHILPKQQKLTRGHHAAMPYGDVPEFVRKLRKLKSPPALALEFLILTAARSGEALGATWGEIDLDGRVWIIPAARMKAGLVHRVPLSPRIVEILEKLAKVRNASSRAIGLQDFVFLGYRRDRPLSGAAMIGVLRRMGVKATVHGFRSAFSDWASETMEFRSEIVEGCLAHVVGSAVSRAYRRTDVLEKRRVVLEAWAAFINGDGSVEPPANEVPS